MRTGLGLVSLSGAALGAERARLEATPRVANGLLLLRRVFDEEVKKDGVFEDGYGGDGKDEDIVRP